MARPWSVRLYVHEALALHRRWRQGERMPSLAGEIGVTPSCLYQLFRRLRAEFGGPAPRNQPYSPNPETRRRVASAGAAASNPGRARLTPEQAREFGRRGLESPKRKRADVD